MTERTQTEEQQERQAGPERGAARAQKEGASSVRESHDAPYTEPGHRARLLSNYNYDLIQELSELLTGVWRIDQYLKDAGGQCDECGRIWQDVRKQKEFLVEKIRQEITNHVKEGRFV